MRTASLLASFGVFSLAVASTGASAQVGIGVYVGPSGPAELLIAPCLECMVIRGAMMV